MKLLLICGIFMWMAIFPASTAEDSIGKLAEDARCASGLKWLEKNSGVDYRPASPADGNSRAGVR